MPQDIYDKIMMLSKRRGFIFPSYEIYGGVAGFYDYGPLGSVLKTNIENLWRYFYLLKDNCVEISTPTITIYEVLKASGHVDEFTDLTVDCKKCKESFKVEGIIDEKTTVEEAVKNKTIKCPNCKSKLESPYEVNLMFSTEIGIGNTRDAFMRPETAQGIFTNFHILYRYAREKLPLGVVQIGKGYRNEVSPRQGTIRMREFNMAEAEVFFNPDDKTHPRFNSVKNKEIHLYDNIKEMKISLDNAVNDKIINNEALAYYMYLTQEFLFTAGVDPKKFRFRKHGDDELAHYASECWDAELYSERFGWVECVGIADRSAYDLSSHIKATNVDMHALKKFNEPQIKTVKRVIPDMGKLGPLYKNKAGQIKQALEKLEIESEKEIIIEIEKEKIKIPKKCYKIVEKEEKITGEKFVPHVIEPSYGMDRIIYHIIEHNFVQTKKKGEQYNYLKFNPIVAPIKTGVFPLVNDDRLIKIAQNIDKSLRDNGISTYYDEGGSIGRRYARMDEIGTPFCITIDHDSIKDKKYTLRHRDTTKQDRLDIKEITKKIKEKIKI